MAIGDYEVLPFSGPTGLPVQPEAVRGNDETLRQNFVGHQDDDVAHIQSGPIASRPATASEGAVWVATDTLVVSLYTSGAWSDIASLIGPSSSTDNAVARWNGAGGHTLQNSVVIVSDTGEVTGVISLNIAGGSATTPFIVTTTGAIIASLRRDANTRIEFKTVTTGLATIDSIGSAPNFAWALNGVEYFNVGSNQVIFGNSTVVKLVAMTSTTSSAGLRLPHGVAPTSPVDGDIWTTTAGLFARINGVTVGPFMAEPAEDLITTES